MDLAGLNRPTADLLSARDLDIFLSVYTRNQDDIIATQTRTIEIMERQQQESELALDDMNFRLDRIMGQK